MKIAIISFTSRQEGCLNGVEKFNWHLQKAIGGTIHTATANGVTHPRALNSILIGNKSIDKDTICVVDGDWGLGIPNDIPVISVVHGSWKEFCIRNGLDNPNVGKTQDEMWHRPNTKLIAVSESAAKYACLHHNVKIDRVILNAVNPLEYKPGERHQPPIVIHAARDFNKNGGRLANIADLVSAFCTLEYLDAKEGEEPEKFSRGSVFLQCSNYEGNSYAALEAMSCGLPVVASRAGLFEDFVADGYPCGISVPWNSSPAVYADAIMEVFEDIVAWDPRGWVMKNCPIEKFNAEWQEVIRGY